MIKIKRKTASVTLQSNTGAEYPDIIIVLDIFSINVIKKSASLRFQLFNSEASFDSNMSPLDTYAFGFHTGSLSFQFTDTSSPSYDTLMSLVDLTVPEFTNQTLVEDWLLAKTSPFVDGGIMSDNWEVLT